MTRMEKDSGAALAGVLVMLAVMAMLAVIVVGAAEMSLRRTGNLARMEQTRWYLIGAESFAAARLADLRRAAPDQGEWRRREFALPLDDGLMRVSLADGGNCFNLNSVVETQEDGVRTASARGMVAFARLMDIVGVRSDRAGLAAALADWIDTDSAVTPGGAEDDPYQGAPGAYRTPNGLIADISELLRVRGFDAAMVSRLKPFICVRPTSAPSLINPNTLLPEQAPILAMSIADLSLPEAQRIIRDRPRGGWAALDDFFAHPAMAARELNEAGRAQFSFEPDFYVLHARVEREGASESSAALLQAGAGAARVVRRVFGVGAREIVL